MEEQKSDYKLNPYELEAVLEWVDSFDLSRSRRKLNRDFSDGVLLAEILKFEFPHLVDLHNYNGCFAVQGRIENWDILNRKVLKKIHIQLKSEEIEKIAKADSNCIEQVLFRVMNQIKDFKNASVSDKSNQEVTQMSSDVMTVKTWKQVGDHVQEVPQQMIVYKKYEELMEKFENQQQKIQELQETVDVMQLALDSKAQIIDDLEKLIDKKEKKSSRTLSIGSLRNSITNLF